MTTKEIIADPLFKDEVRKEIYKLRIEMNSRPEPQPGFRYKRNWYDRMRDRGIFEEKFFVDNILLIWEKKSSLSSEFREVIKFVCSKAFVNVLKHYQKQEQEQEQTK